ncbi:hypothetical protein EGW08_013648 [Elysia chlorotica]|uniref:Uncharacterized protein n=1 Tax=Elysia chlorotica TaxID=188477 RepID=A0A3S0ZII3_ELYCH|nr:hypothetical protein EGW08_013648 [Elysia chlorotica]
MFLNTSLEEYRRQHLHGAILKLRYKDFMMMGARAVNETFRMCLWEGQDIDCSAAITRVFMEGQICFQFNGQLAGGKMVTRAGFTGGLHVVFTINIPGHTNSVNSDSGFKLILHEDPRQMHSSAATVLLAPGFIHHVSLQKHTYSFLPLPFKAFGEKHCQDPPQFLALLSNESYSVDGCVFRRIEQETSRICDCDLANCTVDQHLTCYGPTMQRLYSEPGLTEEALGCPRPCRMDDFPAQVSLSHFPSESDEVPVRALDPYLGASDVRKSYVGLRLNFKDMIVRVSEHVPEQDTKTLFGAIGGHMGLFLGSSILTLVEVVDFIFLLFYNFCVRKSRHTGKKVAEQIPPSVFTSGSSNCSGQPAIRPVIRPS